jgi:putative endonuclease
MYLVYAIRSLSKERIYIGHTNNFEKRLQYHNSGYVKSTSNARPWILLASEEFETRNKARWFERELKRSKGKRKKWIEKSRPGKKRIGTPRREGKGRQYKKEFIQFLYIARGSIFEVVTLTEIFRRRSLFNEEDSIDIRKRCEQIDRKLNGLINSLRGVKRNSQSAKAE